MSSVLAWVNTYHSHDAFIDIEELRTSPLLYTIFCCGKESQTSQSPPKDVLSYVSKHLPNSIPDTLNTTKDLHQLATALLLYLVQSEHGKEQCVQNIMGLSDQDQEELMNIIQLHLATDTPDSPNSPFVSSPMSTTSTSPNNTPNHSHTNGNNTPTNNSTASKLRHLQTSTEKLTMRRRSIRSSLGGVSNNGNTPGRRDSLSSTTSTPDVSSRRLKRDNHILKEEVEWLTRELASQKNSATDAEEKHRHIVEKFKSDQTRNSLQVAEEEEALRASFETSMSEKDQQLQDLSSQVEGKGAMSQQIIKLKDELVIATDNLKEKAKLEDTLNRYKEKHAQVGDLNTQVKTLEETTRSLLTRATKAEDKAGTIPDLKQKLEQYKKAVAAAEVRVSELTVAHKTKDIALHQLKQQCSVMREDSDLRQEEKMDLAMQLSVASDTLAFDAHQHSSLSSFGGMTELNPEVMERVKFLEKENATLRETCDTSTVTKMDELKNQLDDMERLKTNFEQRYHDSGAENRVLSHSLSVSRRTCKDTETKLNTTLIDLKNTKQCLFDTKKSLVSTTASLETLTLTFSDRECSTSQQIFELKARLEKVQNEGIAQQKLFAATTLIVQERTNIKYEDMLSLHIEHVSQHTLSDVQHETEISTMVTESNERMAQQQAEQQAEQLVAEEAFASKVQELQVLEKDLVLFQKKETKVKAIMSKGKIKLKQKEMELSKKSMKMKQGTQLLKKFKKQITVLENELETTNDNLVVLKQDIQMKNALLRNNGCTEGDPSSRRSASKLASELDRVISENKKLQKELDVKNRQLAEEVEEENGTSRSGRRTRSGFKKETDTSSLSLLENENKKLKKENKTLSMMKTVYTREQHQFEDKEQILKREKKELEEVIVSLRLEMERTGVKSVKKKVVVVEKENVENVEIVEETGIRAASKSWNRKRSGSTIDGSNEVNVAEDSEKGENGENENGCPTQ